jgi:predicted enzyme related to lactoylglutathione lyase
MIPLIHRLTLMTTPIKVLEFAFVAYPATEMERSCAFYEGILGLTRGMSMLNGNDFWVEYDVGPHTLGIGNEPFMKPANAGPQLVLEVDDFDATIEFLKSSGVPFHVEPFDMPACRAAVVLDPDGNAIGIHKRNSG